MLKVKPKLTEKALSASKLGRYTFSVPLVLTAGQAKAEIESQFGVKVGRLWSLKEGAELKQSRRQKKILIPAQKVVIVTLEKGHLDFFEPVKEAAVTTPEKDKTKVKAKAS